MLSQTLTSYRYGWIYQWYFGVAQLASHWLNSNATYLNRRKIFNFDIPRLLIIYVKITDCESKRKIQLFLFIKRATKLSSISIGSMIITKFLTKSVWILMLLTTNSVMLETKREYNRRVHQLFVDLKETYYSARMYHTLSPLNSVTVHKLKLHSWRNQVHNKDGEWVLISFRNSLP